MPNIANFIDVKFDSLVVKGNEGGYCFDSFKYNEGWTELKRAVNNCLLEDETLTHCQESRWFVT